MTGSVIIDSGMLSCGDDSPPLLAGGGEEESFPLLRIDSSPPGGAGGPHDEEGSLDDLIAGYLAEEPLSLGLRGERGAAPPPLFTFQPHYTQTSNAQCPDRSGIIGEGISRAEKQPSTTAFLKSPLSHGELLSDQDVADLRRVNTLAAIDPSLNSNPPQMDLPCPKNLSDLPS